MSLLAKFEDIIIESNSWLEQNDLIFLDNLQKEFVEYLKYKEKEKHFYETNNMHNSFVNNKGAIREIEKDIQEKTERFCYKIFNHFEYTYNIQLNYRYGNIVQDLGKEQITHYQDVLDVIREQLDGLTFTERAISELKTNLIHQINRQKLSLQKNKIIIKDYVYWSTRWNGVYYLSWSNQRLSYLYRALSHFEYGITEIAQLFDSWYRQMSDSAESFFGRKNEVNLNKINSMKFFKNGKVEIEFNKREYAETFYNEYCVSKS